MADTGIPSFESFSSAPAASPVSDLGGPAAGIAVAGLGDLEAEREERGSRHKSRRKSLSPVMVVLPVACLALLVGGVAAYFLLIKPSAVQGDLTAEVLRGDELAPVLVDKTFADLTDSRPVGEALAKQPLQFNSPTVGMEVSAQETQLKVSVRTGVESVFYRVTMDGGSRVEKYLQKNRALFDKQRAEDLFEDGQKFVAELQKLIRTPEKGSQGMEKFRNTVGLASLVKGLGYHVVARYRGELFRCVYEDAEGRLYFLMPKGVTQFQIIGRGELPTRHQPFSGTFQVKVKSTPVDLPPLPPAPKAKQENDAPAKKKAEKPDEPAPRSEEEPPGMIDQIKPAKKKVQLKDG